MKYFKHTREGHQTYYASDTPRTERGINFSHSPGNRHFDEMMLRVASGEDEIIEVDDTPVPTVDELRIAAYGSIGDQLDEINHDVDAWRTRIAAVKLANPK